MKHEFSRILNAAADCELDSVALPLMYKPSVAETASALPSSSTVLNEEERPPAVLMLHGFTGNPGELQYAAARIAHAGYTVSVPRLPGHGTGGKDFLLTKAVDWIRRSVDAYMELSAQASSVSLVGLSMGALIAVLMAATFKVHSLAMCAPALEVNQPFLSLTPIIGRFVKSYGGSYDPEKVKPEFRALAHEYRSRRWVRGAGELYRLQRAARVALPHISCPITTLLAAGDPTVPLSVQTRIRDSVTTADHDLRVFAGNDHVILNGAARDQVLDVILERLRSHNAPFIKA